MAEVRVGASRSKTRFLYVRRQQDLRSGGVLQREQEPGQELEQEVVVPDREQLNEQDRRVDHARLRRVQRRRERGQVAVQRHLQMMWIGGTPKPPKTPKTPKKTSDCDPHPMIMAHN